MTEHISLIINGAAVSRSSRGVQRYFDRVMHFLDWPGKVTYFDSGRSSSWDRVRELLHPGQRDAVFWTPCQRGSLHAKRHVVTVHDCINVEYIFANDWRLAAYRRIFNMVLTNACAVVAISEATKAAILRNYEMDAKRITVIRSGDDVAALPNASIPTITRGQQNKPFALMVINALPHKNALAACKAFAASSAIRAGLSLRIAGCLPEAALDVLGRAGVSFELHPWADELLLSSWYASCQFLLSPSLDEGHNLVIAEALAYGANVLCSDIVVHREFYDGRVRFFDPSRHDSMVTAIDAAIETPGPWGMTSESAVSRSFRDVAHDYRLLFREIAR